MFFLQDEEITPNIGVGAIKLGMNRNDLEKMFQDYSINKLVDFDVYVINDIKVWVSKTDNIVTQILVYGNFRGKLLNEFGIGSYLSNIENKLNLTSREDQSVYIFDDLKGICFELSDIEDDWNDINWFKQNAPIEAISVFKDA